jgi:hypothetical protein
MDGSGFFGTAQNGTQVQVGIHHSLIMRRPLVSAAGRGPPRASDITLSPRCSNGGVSIELLDVYDRIASRGLWGHGQSCNGPRHISSSPWHVMYLVSSLSSLLLIFGAACVKIWQKIAIAFELLFGGLMLATNVWRLILDMTPWNHLCAWKSLPSLG